MSKQIALVTGGSSGIGRSLCLKLVDEGYQVFSASRSQNLPQAMSGISQLAVDFSVPGASGGFARKFIADYGIPDLLINNAGCGAFFEWEKFPDSEISKQIELLFSAPVQICRVFAPAMQKEERGVILNLSSLATHYPLPYMPMYNAGKSALSSFTESMMLEYQNFPKFIDFRMGDVRTGFNKSAYKQENLNKSMKSAWNQIELQLNKSIPVDFAVSQIFTRIRNGNIGTFYGGSFFHRIILPTLYRVLPRKIRTILILLWYG